MNGTLLAFQLQLILFIFFHQERKKKEEKEKKEKEEKEKSLKDVKDNDDSEKEIDGEKIEEESSDKDASQVIVQNILFAGFSDLIHTKKRQQLCVPDPKLIVLLCHKNSCTILLNASGW